MENGFDVFISFKNTEKNGRRTRDSAMAEELYYALRERGIRAFYSNISVSEHGEHRFGKIIREAIEQSTIFVGVGTSIENFESGWVEYERESFHEEMMNGNKPRTRSAMFSYITRNVPTNRLPMELRRCQAFYELDDIVDSICARIQKESEIIQNFESREISVKSLSPGTLVDGRYRIVSKIGRGGMSEVYLAADVRLHRSCAIKVVRMENVKDFRIVKDSLRTEVEMLNGLDHPGLPKIIDAIDANESFVIIMDYVEGQTLESRLKERGVQPEKSVIDWAKQLCDILGYLHTQTPPIIYRDVKPGNIMLRTDQRLVLIDFGIAREYKEQNLADTVCLGTLGYAAPEQYGGMGQTDQRTDIYALGVTLHHLVTGQDPAQPPYELYPIRQIVPQLSDGLEAIIEKCTHRNPEERYQTVAELLYDLNHIDKIGSKQRRKKIAQTVIDRISGQKARSDRRGGKKENIAPPLVTNELRDAAQKSASADCDTVRLCCKAAVCVSTKSKARAGDQVNIYFATEASGGDIIKLVTSKPEYTEVAFGKKVIDIGAADVVKLRLESRDLIFSPNELKFLWSDYSDRQIRENFSFQILDVLKTEGASFTVQVYVNNERVIDVQAAFE